jgi:large subunit ribosomal protein L25
MSVTLTADLRSDVSKYLKAMNIGGFMKLKVFKRESLKKSETKNIRRAGNIPAIIYVRGKATDNICLEGQEFNALLRQVTNGRLSTTVLTLIGEDGKERRAIIKDIQYEPTTYRVEHLDFEELFPDIKVNVKVPIECTGIVDCIGVKLGGILRQVIRYLRVRCLPKDIPSVFQLDVKNLGQNESKRLSDLGIPQAIRPLADLNEVVVVVAKR